MACGRREGLTKGDARIMKLHIITVGEPKLPYAKDGWIEYTKRLNHFHQLRITHLSDKQNSPDYILLAASRAYKVAMVIEGAQLTSAQLAAFLEQSAGNGREVCFIIGGPDGLPNEVIHSSDKHLSLSKLTFPHDLAMVILAETLYRASSINAGHPYHRA